MNIMVNGSPIDFALETDIPLIEILEHIREWGGQHKMYILDYNVSCKDDKNNVTTELFSNHISHLDISMGTQLDLLKENIEELDQYIDKTLSFIIQLMKVENSSTEDRDSLREALSWIVESLVEIKKRAQKDIEEQLMTHIELLYQHISNVKDIIDNKAVIKLSITLNSVKNCILGLKRTYLFSDASKQDLKRLLQEFYGEIPHVLNDLDTIATYLTVGEENKAIMAIEHLIEILSDGITLLYLNQKNEVERKKIITILNELTNDLTVGNLVNSADLIDYDLRDTLQVLTG